MSPAAVGLTGPPYRSFGACGLLLLLLASLWLGLIYGPSPYASIEHLRHIRYHDGTFQHFLIPLSAVTYWWARLALLALLVSCIGLAIWQFRPNGLFRAELAALGREFRQAPSLLAPWRALRPIERRVALTLLLLLTLVRGYYVLRFPLYGDELVTFLSFVREGPVAATSFYPIPNNHLLYSSICWIFSLISGNFLWVIRLPTLLISSIGTVLVGLLLLRQLPFRVVALTIFPFGFFSHALLQAAVGRGYALQVVCAQVGFVAALALLRSTVRPRLGWSILLAVSILGLYAVPTFLLAFGALCGGLGLAFGWQRQSGQLGRLLLAGLLVGSTALLLYAPVLLVSGPGALFDNSYVALSQKHAVGLLAWLNYLGRAEGELLGHNPMGVLLSGGLTLATLAAGRWWPAFRGQHEVALLALALVWGPHLLLALRGLEAPARALSFRGFFLLLLAALLLNTLLRQWRIERLLLTVALPVVVWAAGALWLFQRQVASENKRNGRVAEVYVWLRQHRAHRVLVTRGHYQLYLWFFSETGPWPLRLDDAPAAGVSYDFQLLDKGNPTESTCAGRVVFENADVRVCQLPAP